MHWWQAIILGIVEGLTEYLPVSSTGHLILVQRAMGLPSSDAANAYAVCIQAGAIVAVLGLYAKRVHQMLRGLVGRDPIGRRMAVNVVVAFLPAAVVGKLLDAKIEELLFGLWPVVGAWVVGGVAILVVSRWQRRRDERAGPAAGGAVVHAGKDLEHLGWLQALAIGGAQCLAMWPGTSRSFVTIVAALLLGLSMPAAVEFSFLLGVLTLSAATAYKGLKSGGVMLHAYGVADIAIGFVLAAVSAVAAVKWMVGYLNRHGLAIFGYWRLALGAVIAALIVLRLLTP